MINLLTALTGDLNADIAIYIALATTVVGTACTLIKTIRVAIIETITAIGSAIVNTIKAIRDAFRKGEK